LAFENEAGRLRKLARSRDVLFFYSDHAVAELNKDGIFKITVENMLRKCRVTNVEESDGETSWRAEGTDNDGRRIVVVVIAYEDPPKEIKVITGWAHKDKR
jgi:hypothetical protein